MNDYGISPSILVIFGATGDLAKRKLMPALFDLYMKGILPKSMKIVGFARRDLGDSEFREFVGKVIIRRTKKTDPAYRAYNNFEGILSYVRGDFGEIGGYEGLKAALGRQDNKWKFCANKLFYLATPPQFYGAIVDNLAKSGLTEPCSPKEGWTRVILEKPFGRDFDSARALDLKLARIFEERQIYRIDHFLGKESLQNILAFRFGNSIFEPVWNNQYIDHIQILASEKLGLEGRVTFYDHVGAIRDMVQSHLLQMVASVAMDRPASMKSEHIRDQRARILKKIRCINLTNRADKTNEAIVVGQYRGYIGEKGVYAKSETETFAALKLEIEAKRWKGTPFYLMTGKKLKKDMTRIIVAFKTANGSEWERMGSEKINKIIFEMKPKDKIVVQVNMKEPGLEMRLKLHEFIVDYGKVHNHRLLDAYEKLLVDCMLGDQTLFARTDGVLASWKFISPIIEAAAGRDNLIVYNNKSWGPKEARELIERDGREWYLK